MCAKLWHWHWPDLEIPISSGPYDISTPRINKNLNISRPGDAHSILGFVSKTAQNKEKIMARVSTQNSKMEELSTCPFKIQQRVLWKRVCTKFRDCCIIAQNKHKIMASVWIRKLKIEGFHVFSPRNFNRFFLGSEECTKSEVSCIKVHKICH